MAVQRSTLPSLATLMDESWGDANAELRADLQHVFQLICRRLGGAHPVSSVLQLGVLEPRVVLATVQRTRFLPRGVEQPMDGELPRQDPGPEAADQGAPWRSCTGLERSMLLLIFNDARQKLGLTAVLDGSHDGAAAVPLQQFPQCSITRDNFFV